MEQERAYGLSLILVLLTYLVLIDLYGQSLTADRAPEIDPPCSIAPASETRPNAGAGMPPPSSGPLLQQMLGAHDADRDQQRRPWCRVLVVSERRPQPTKLEAEEADPCSSLQPRAS
jgi:hypothetical protein